MSASSAERASLQRLRTLLIAEGGLIASLVGGVAQSMAGDSDGMGGSGGSANFSEADSDGIEGPAQLAASGPRAEGRREEYELLVETIYEGYLLHYGTPRVVCTREADLGVLAGDRLYALGLARLVALGDTAAVAELADTITLGALAQGAGDAELADAIWMAGARAVGWGSSVAHRRAKELVFAGADGGADGAIEAMRTSAVAPPTPS
jgi:hypothetical protein